MSEFHCQKCGGNLRMGRCHRCSGFKPGDKVRVTEKYLRENSDRLLSQYAFQNGNLFTVYTIPKEGWLTIKEYNPENSRNMSIFERAEDV